MRKPLLLCLLLAIWGQASSQSIKFKDARPAEGLSSLSKAKLTNSAPVAYTSSTKALSSSGKPVYWPDRVYVKFKAAQTQLNTFDSKALRPAAKASNKVNYTFQRYDAHRVKELPRSSKLPNFKNTYEVVLEKGGKVDQLLAELNKMPEVEYAERVPYYVTMAPSNDPHYQSGKQYAMDKIQAFEAFGIQKGKTKTLLAIVDDAVLVTHPDLAANINLAKSYDVADLDNDPRPPSSGKNKAQPQTFSHGTHCAGIAGAVTNNGTGIASVSNNSVSIIAVKATGDEITDSRAIEFGTEGVIHAINQGARVISMSYGGTGFSKTDQDIIDQATANGVVFVAAAGNDDVNVKNYPAAYDNVIAVASSDGKDLKSDFSNYGSWVDVSAPGTGITSTVAGADGVSGAYVSISGTSMATPMVAGLVALMLSENPNLAPQAVTEILKTSADPIDAVTGQAPEYAGMLGAGRINAFKAIQAIQGITSTVAPAAITDLTLTSTGQISAELTWTAPSMEGAETASMYDVRYATAPITESNFNEATKANIFISPGKAGVSQQLEISNLNPGTTYYFAVVARSFYGVGSAISNVVSATMPAAPRLQLAAPELTFNINRDQNQTSSKEITLKNAGAGNLQYILNLLPGRGPNLLSYDKARPRTDYVIGAKGNTTYITATKFVADARGFNLTHVQNYIHHDTIADATIGIRIYKGGKTPADATLLSSESIKVSVPAGGNLFTFPLKTAQQLKPGETFWVAFVLPENLYYAIGIDETTENPGTMFVSENGGKTYEDLQLLGKSFSTVVYKIRAINAGWLTATPATGTLAANASGKAALTVDVKNLANGTYKAELITISSDPVAPYVSNPITLNVTGGQAALVNATTALDFGGMFIGTIRTRNIILQNKGVKELVLQDFAIAAGSNFAASDFVLPTRAITILPGATHEIPVTFRPSKNAALTGRLTFRTNDPAAALVSVPLSSTSQSAPVASISTKALDLSLCNTATATANVTLSNGGEADLVYTLTPVIPVTASSTYPVIKYDPERGADGTIGLGTPDSKIFTAVQFDVTTKTFNLSYIQNNYNTGSTAKPIEIFIIKGGKTPIQGELLQELSFTAEAGSGTKGAYTTIPLGQVHRFVEGDVFWVVVYYENVPSPQGFNDEAAVLGHSFVSMDGEEWTDLNEVNDDFKTGAFKIRAFDVAHWLSVTPASGVLTQAASVESTVSVNRSGLAQGTYKGSIKVTTNDPAFPNQTIEVNLVVPPAKPVITQSGNLLSSSNATGNQWYLNGNAIQGATASTYPLTQPGKYTVITSVDTGCASKLSDEFTATLLSAVEELDEVKEVKVYPNPAAGAFFISFTVTKPEDVTIRVVNLTGQLIFEEQLEKYTGAYGRKVSMSTSGLYIVQIQQGGKLTTRKIVVTH